MKVLAISWAGVRTQQFANTIQFFANNMEFPISLRDDEREVAHFRSLTFGWLAQKWNNAG